MALRKNMTQTVEVPNEPGEWLTIRLLGFAELDEAKQIASRRSFENIKALGGDIYRAILNRDKQAEEAAALDPLSEYDLTTLLTKGIIAWSYEDGKPNAADIATLDPATAQWAAKLIVGIETGESRKNDSDASTSPSTDEVPSPASG